MGVADEGMAVQEIGGRWVHGCGCVDVWMCGGRGWAGAHEGLYNLAAEGLAVQEIVASGRQVGVVAPASCLREWV